MNAEKSTEILEQHPLPSRPHLYSDVHAFLNETMKTTLFTHDEDVTEEEEGPAAVGEHLQQKRDSDRRLLTPKRCMKGLYFISKY